MYDNIKMPKRATKGSAGYDFFSPFYFFLPSWGDITIPTGIRAWMDDGWVLEIYPRSGSGMKHYVRLANSVGVVDKDYFDNPTNEGHIMVKLRKESGLRDTSTPTVDAEFKAGDAFCQGIFREFGIAFDDFTDGERTGGFGSTNN
jgi:dUTP pyrophosphatase